MNDREGIAPLPGVVEVIPGGGVERLLERGEQPRKIWGRAGLIPSDLIGDEENLIKPRRVRSQRRVAADGSENYHVLNPEDLTRNHRRKLLVDDQWEGILFG